MVAIKKLDEKIKQVGGDGIPVYQSGDLFLLKQKVVFEIMSIRVNHEFGYYVLFKCLFGNSSKYQPGERYIFEASIFKALHHAGDIEKFFIENNTFFYFKRVAKNFDTTLLEETIGKLSKVTVKTGSRYKLLPGEIGNPDWIVKFKSSDRGPLAKISALVREFSGSVFIGCFNIYRYDKFNDASSMFYAIYGVDVSPDECAKLLEKNVDF